MKIAYAMAAIAAGGVVSIANAQPTGNPPGYEYEFRIIADGDVGAPTGPGTLFPRTTVSSQIGFWLQARVRQSVNENWGITRVSPPAAPETSFVTVTDSVGSSLQRGTTNSSNTNFGRGSGYRNGGPNTGATGNAGGSVAFPGVTNNQNGAIDSGGTRIYSFDSYVGSDRPPQNADDPSNPWGVNGSLTPSSPIPSDGVTWSPWASVYRFVVLPTNSLSQRTITLDAYALINGAVAVRPTDAGLSRYAMEVGPGRNMGATYSFTYGIPTPGAAALLGMGALTAGRRRR